MEKERGTVVVINIKVCIKGLLGLCTQNKGEKENCNSHAAIALIFCRALSAPDISPI
jgi:hypothetical protein